MPLSFTVNGLGTFTASVTDGSEVYTVVMTGGTASFTAAIAPVGPKGDTGATGNTGATGPQGPSGVVAATAPITYNSGTQTVAIDTTYFVRSPAVAGTDGYILSWDGTTSRPVWVQNETGTVYTTGTNKTGATLAKGTVVYINGAQGSKFTIAKAVASGDATSAQTLGVVQSDIANNAAGVVITFGEISGLDTSSYSDGTQLYLSPNTAGTFTSTKPSAPDHLVYVAVVSYAHQNQGKILVKIQNGYELEELHNVAIASVADKNLLAYESATSLWKNKTFTALDLLTSTTAASTYQTQAGMSAYLTTSSASSTYLTQSNAASTYQTISGMSSYLTTSSAASTYLTQSNAASTYQTQAGMSSYLTTASAASTYQTQAGMSSYLTTSSAASTYAPLASPTFTGDPKAPTPATSDNDTSIATTAFGQALVDAQRVDIQTFGSSSSSGTFTWTKPSGAKMVQVYMVGAGGGGAGGACSTTGLTRSGGGGGGAASSAVFFIPASELGSTVTVTVGAGGTGGAGRSTTGASTAGNSGGTTGFGNYRVQAGTGASANASVAGATGSIMGLASATVSPTSGAGNATTGSNATGVTSGIFSPTGGGGGGGAAGGSTTAAAGGSGGSRTNTTAPSFYTSTLAGGSGGTAGGTAATNGTAGDTVFAGGTGGGGGFYITGQATGAGGNGGYPGGGGGGGGASDSGFLSGKGGDGANGEVIVITYF